MRLFRRVCGRTGSESRYPNEALVMARILESAGSNHQRIEVENGPELWAYVHDGTCGIENAVRRCELVRITLVFNCHGLAETVVRAPEPRLVPIDDERSGHYRFVGRVRSVIERKTPSRIPTDIPDSSVWHSVILDAEIPLWCHFYAREAVPIEPGSVIDVNGQIMMELAQPGV